MTELCIPTAEAIRPETHARRGVEAQELRGVGGVDRGAGHGTSWSGSLHNAQRYLIIENT